MPLYAPGSGPHKTTHENAGSDEIDATGLTGAGGGGGGWETESTDATKLETGRQRIWDENLDASIVLDGSITLIGGTGWGIEAQLDTGEVFEVGGDGIVVAVLASEPATGIDGQIYYNSATDKFRTRVNGAWQDMTAAAGAHNTTHQNGGADEISIAGLDGTPVELTNHIADATDAHDASAISFDDTGLTITAADVQTMGEQLDAAISAGGIPATIFDAAGDIIYATAADTAARKPLGAAGGALSRLNGALDYNSGTANPTATTGDRFWRTDLEMEIYYDGTRWLTTTLYRVELAGPFDGDATAVNNGWPNTVSGKNVSRTALWHTDFAIWLVSLYGGTFVSTTNDGSNFWTGALTGGVTSTAYGNFTTAAHSPNVHTGSKAALNVAAGSTERVINFAYTKTGTPGSIYGPAAVTYRLIVV